LIKKLKQKFLINNFYFSKFSLSLLLFLVVVYFFERILFSFFFIVSKMLVNAYHFIPFCFLFLSSSSSLCEYIVIDIFVVAYLYLILFLE
jgi:hypothetical protein